MTDFVRTMHEVCKNRVPNHTMFPRHEGCAGWPLWSYVLAGTGKLTDKICRRELHFNNDVDISDTAYVYHVGQHDFKTMHLPDNTNYIRDMQ
jgi:hypothetical protein